MPTLKLRTDHPVTVYKTCEFSGTVLRLFSCLPPYPNSGPTSPPQPYLLNLVTPLPLDIPPPAQVPRTVPPSPTTRCSLAVLDSECTTGWGVYVCSLMTSCCLLWGSQARTGLGDVMMAQKEKENVRNSTCLVTFIYGGGCSSGLVLD